VENQQQNASYKVSTSKAQKSKDTQRNEKKSNFNNNNYKTI
jgi:hypothetical protein